jgi:hypothetical protein
MALTTDQKSSRLFKKSLGASETLTTRDFFEEPRLGKSSILPNQIWSEANQIPIPAPTLTNSQIEGVVQYFEKLALTHVSGSGGRAFYHASLKNSITFNFDTGGTYNYALYKSDSTTVIPFGQGDWLIDNEAGVLTFYGSLPSAVSDVQPPQVSFYKYVGALGLPSGSTAGLNVHDSVRFATTGQTDATYSTATSGFTTLPSNVDGATTFNEGDRILIKNQAVGYENGVYVVSGTTLVRAQDSNGQPYGEVSLNDYVFVESGSTNIATSWVIGSSSSLNPQGYITVGVDTQVWTIFATSRAYTADGNALKLDGSIFSVDLNDNEFSGVTFHNYNSGLYQSIDGLRLATPVVTDILALSATTSTLTSSISSLETLISNGDASLSTAVSSISGQTASLSTAISSEISTRGSADSSLENVISLGDASLSTVVSSLSGQTTSLATAISLGDASLSTAISTLISGNTYDDTSLSTAISTEISNRTSGDTSLSTVISSEISTRGSADTSITTAINNLSGVTAQTAGSGLTYNSLEQSLNVNVDGLTIEISSDVLQVATGYTSSLSTAIGNAVTGLTSLSTAISINTSNITILSGETSSLSTALSNVISGNTYDDTSLSTAISTEISNRLSGDTSLGAAISSGDLSLSTAISSNYSTLSTSISGEASTRGSADTSITTAINNLSGVTAQTAGSGLTFNSAETSLNVNVDNYTIKIVNDELRGSQVWIQSTYSANVVSGTTGSTGLVLTYEPITPVQASINGIEYLISVTTSSQTNMPFYFNAYPAVQGSTLNFDATEGGFGIESGIDLIVIKYSYIDIT